MNEPRADDSNNKTNERCTLEQVSLDNIFLDSDFQALIRESISSSGQTDSGYDYNSQPSWFWEVPVCQDESNPLVIQPLEQGENTSNDEDKRHVIPCLEVSSLNCRHSANESHTSRCRVVSENIRVELTGMVTTRQHQPVCSSMNTTAQMVTGMWVDNETNKEIDDKALLDISGYSKGELNSTGTQMGYNTDTGFISQGSNVSVAAATDTVTVVGSCSSLEGTPRSKVYNPSTYTTCKTYQTLTTQSSQYVGNINKRPDSQSGSQKALSSSSSVSGNMNVFHCQRDQYYQASQQQQQQLSQMSKMSSNLTGQNYHHRSVHPSYLSMLPPPDVKCLPGIVHPDKPLSNVTMNVYSPQDVNMGDTRQIAGQNISNIYPSSYRDVHNRDQHVKGVTNKSDILHEVGGLYNSPGITVNPGSVVENMPLTPTVKLTNESFFPSDTTVTSNLMNIPLHHSNMSGVMDTSVVKQEKDSFGGFGYFSDSSSRRQGYLSDIYRDFSSKNQSGLCSDSTTGRWGMCSTLLSSSDTDIPASMTSPQHPTTSKTEADFQDVDSNLGLMDFEESGIDGLRGKRLNHSEIEKRRRDKMNAYIVELADLIPMCGDVNRKLDKLTVLRMAVQHIKALKGTGDSPTEVSHLPSFIADEEVKKLVLKASQGFIFSVSCDRGKILHVSDTVVNILNYRQSELAGKYLFDFLHHKDVHKVKDQLATNEFVSKERYIDAKTMKLVRTKLPQTNSDLRSGGRRLFVCRMKRNKNCDNADNAKESRGDSLKSKGPPVDGDYVTVVCSGYIKVWTAKPGVGPTEEDDSNSGEQRTSINLNKLVAVALPVNPIDYQEQSIPEPEQRRSALEFMSRLNIEGKFVYVDHRVTSVLGYVPQELINTSIYEYCHPEYISSFSQIHKQVLISREKIENRIHKFKTKNRSTVLLSTSAFVFRNPWTKEREHIVCNHRLVFRDRTCPVTSSSEEELDKYPDSDRVRLGGRSMLSIAPHDVSQIGKQIALQIHGPSHAPRHIADSTMQSSSSRDRAQSPSQQTSSSCIDSSSGTETTDEASMAIIMNLLEADAGLGGPVDFSDLPWPL